MKTYRVTHVVEIESFVQASDEDEALRLANEELPWLEDGMVVVSTEAQLYSDFSEDDDD